MSEKGTKKPSWLLRGAGVIALIGMARGLGRAFKASSKATPDKHGVAPAMSP